MVVALVALPDVREDAERRARGVTVEDWVNAPRPPAIRGECEDGARPCPALRCKYHLGRYGEREGFSCWLDVTELPDDERTFVTIGRLVNVNKHRAHDDVTSAFEKIEQSDPETLRLLGVRRRHA